MSKTLNKEKIRYPEGFPEEVKAICVEKKHQIRTEIDKNTKNLILENFMEFLCTFRKTWWLRMLKTFSKEQIRCRCCFFDEIKTIDFEKMHQIHTEIDKNTKKSNFWYFMQFLCTFWMTWWLRMLKTFSKEQIRCRGCFFGEIRAIDVEKMHRIQTEIDKNTKKPD